MGVEGMAAALEQPATAMAMMVRTMTVMRQGTQGTKWKPIPQVHVSFTADQQHLLKVAALLEHGPFSLNLKLLGGTRVMDDEEINIWAKV